MIEIFEKSIGLILDIRLWSGSKKLKDEDFQGVELPPEELVCLGSKRIHNVSTLKPIQAVRTKAVSFLESVAVSLYGGKLWIVPESMIAEVDTTLRNLADEFAAAKEEFLDQFYSAQRQWLDQNKKWATIIEPHLETPESVARKFDFSWRTFRMSSACDDGIAETMAGDITNNLLKEISALAAEAYETLKDKDRATPKNLNRLDRLSSKLQGLAFVDPGVGIIEQELSQILQSKDSKGNMSGQNVSDLARLLVQLKNPTVLAEVLDAASNGGDYQFTYGGVQASIEDDVPTSPKALTKSGYQPRLPDAWF